jgi:hypothetical protein
MKVEQFGYLSPEAVSLRQRDGIPPWGVHPCEVDSIAPEPGTAFHASWMQAKRFRAEIEADTE